MFSSYDAKEINTLILRHAAENGEVEVLKTWVVKQQPKRDGPQIHIDPHPKSTQNPSRFGGQNCDRQSILMKFPNWNEPISFQRILTRREGTKGDLYTVYDQIFPFEPPYATAFNQVQGLTLRRILIETSDQLLHPVAFYCAASRVQTGDGLLVTSLNPDPTKLTSIIRADKQVVEQIKEWKDMADTDVLPF